MDISFGTNRLLSLLLDTKGNVLLSDKYKERLQHNTKVYAFLFGLEEAPHGCVFEDVVQTQKPGSFCFSYDPEKPSLILEFIPLLEGSHILQSIILNVYEDQFEEGDAHGFEMIPKVERDLEKKLSLQRDFLRMATHQMNHPITLLRGYTQLLLDDPREQYRVVIEQELKYLGKLLEELTRFTHLNSVEKKFSFFRVDMIGFLESLFQEFYRKNSTHIFVFEKPSIDFLFAKIDQSEFGEALRVIIENAYKYVPEGGQIILGLDQGDERVHIWIEDNGEGIAPEYIDLVFEPFVRIDQTTKGSGLGLSIARRIIEIHNGTIHVTSPLENDKKGTRFDIYLPKIKMNNQV